MSQNIEFNLPEGLSLPEGINPGEAFEVMATLQLGENGAAMLMEIDGAPVSAPEEETEEAPVMEEDAAAAEEEMGFLDAVERRAAE